MQRIGAAKMQRISAEEAARASAVAARAARPSPRARRGRRRTRSADATRAARPSLRERRSEHSRALAPSRTMAVDARAAAYGGADNALTHLLRTALSSNGNWK
jgi:hypothetical protein